MARDSDMSRIQLHIFLCALASAFCLVSTAHFEVTTPYEGEIFAVDDVYFEFRIHDWDGIGEIMVGVNTNEAMRTKNVYSFIRAPGLPPGLHYFILQVIGEDGEPIEGITADVPFEVTTLQPPETIIPLPEGSVGIRSEDLPLDPNADPVNFSGKMQRMLYQLQHPDPAACAQQPFLIWEPWGIVGFGAQLLGLRVGLSLGLQTGRVVVGNPEWENNLVNSELKWRFNLSHSDQGSPWGATGSLQALSHCVGASNVADSVRALPGVDMHDHSISNVRVAGDLWGVENRDRLFDIPERAQEVFPEGNTNLFWWWTETTNFLHRPTPKLGDFMEGQKQRMGWKHPIIGIHMRLGVDKNREAQRFPTKYYIHEARRIRKLFGSDVGTIFVCSDRRRAIDKMVKEYGNEFDILVQPRVEGALPMEYVHTDLALLGECDYLIMTISSNFGMAALFLNAFNHGHRPTYISMDDLFEGFRYYGHQMTLSYNTETGINEFGIRNCATQLLWHGRTVLLVDDKRETAEEMCGTLMGEEVCRQPRLLRWQDTGEVIWDNTSCDKYDDFDQCWQNLQLQYACPPQRPTRARFQQVLSETEHVNEKGDCEEECDDKGCVSLSEGNRRVLGFGVKLPKDEF